MTLPVTEPVHNASLLGRKTDMRPIVGPFALIETLVFLCAEGSILLNPNVAPASRFPTAIEIAAFCLMRVGLPWARRRTRRVWVFVAIELALLILISAQVNGSAITIISVSVALRSAELLRPPITFVATGTLLVAVLAAMTFWGRVEGVSWATIGGWAVITSLAWGLTGALTSFAAGERRANAELRKYAAISAEVAAAEERGRIALELHDDIGHALTALNVQLESALRLRSVDGVAADTLILSAKGLGSQALASVRSTVAQLRADPLEREPLIEILTGLCDRFEQTIGRRIERELEPVIGEPVSNTAVTRIVEEALMNVVRHSGASTVSVCLTARHERNVLEMRDNGRGFERSDIGTGHGLAIMRERANAADIDLDIDSAPAHGTTVRIMWQCS